MKSLLLSGLVLMSLTVEAHDKDRDDHQKEHGGRKNFEVIPLNSPVKETMVKLLLKGPAKISKVLLENKHGGKKEFEATLEQTPNGYVASFKGSYLKVGTYEYKVRALVPNEHHGHNKHDQECQKGFVDHVRFVIDPSLEVADPGEAGMKTLLGIDSDKDGIRDDVQRWINENVTVLNQKKALKQYAKYTQAGMSVVDDKQASIEATKKELDASGCIRATIGGDILAASIIRKKVKVEITNTKERFLAQEKADLNFSGATRAVYDPLRIPDAQKCEFNLQ